MRYAHVQVVLLEPTGLSYMNAWLTEELSDKAVLSKLSAEQVWPCWIERATPPAL